MTYSVAAQQAGHSGLFDGIKEEIVFLLKKNTATQKEYFGLKQEFETLQQEVANKARDLQELRNQGGRDINEVKRRFWKDIPSGDIKAIESAILVQKARNIYLKGQIIDVEEGVKLKELEVLNLGYFKRELELKLRQQEYLQSNYDRQAGAEAKELEKVLAQKEQLQAQFQAAIEEGRRELKALPRDIKAARREVRNLEARLVDLQRTRDLQKRSAGPSTDSKKDLREEIKHLEQENADLRERLKESKSKLEEEQYFRQVSSSD